MKKGIGKAIEIGIGRYSFPEEVPKKDKSILSSEKRLSILSYLLNYPCPTLSTISGSLYLSLGSVRWHLGILKESALIRRKDRRYFVDGSILPQHIELFGTLHNPIEKKMTEVIIRRGPLKASELKRAMKTSSQLLRYHLKRLERAGVIHEVRGLYELAFDLIEFQRVYGTLMEKSLAKVATDARFEGISMEIRRRPNGFFLRVLSPINASFDIYEVPFYEVLG